MITRDEAVQMAKNTHSYRNFSHAFVLELLKEIIQLHDKLEQVEVQKARLEEQIEHYGLGPEKDF